MSQQIIDHSPDLKRLRDEGYDVQIRDLHLFLASIPYLNSKKEVAIGTLVSELTISGLMTGTPKDHTAHFIGEYPCNLDGTPMNNIKHPSTRVDLGSAVGNNWSFSSKPESGSYANYYDKMTRYIRLISAPARATADVTAVTNPVIMLTEEESPFKFFDSASSRAGIGEQSNKLKCPRVAIVGLGGTGSYLLDFIAKTPVNEIHLFDGGIFQNHNAFRAPGSPTIEQLEAKQKKVTYLTGMYSRMRRRIVPHEQNIDENNVELLRDMSFVFLCIDGGPLKQMIIDQMEQWNLPFIDVGMGIQLINGALRGQLATATSVPDHRETAKARICCADTKVEDVYSENIQLSELNAMNAAMAVIKWKKLCGFYHDTKKELYSAYTITGNILTNEGIRET